MNVMKVFDLETDYNNDMYMSMDLRAVKGHSFKRYLMRNLFKDHTFVITVANYCLIYMEHLSNRIRLEFKEVNWDSFGSLEAYKSILKQHTNLKYYELEEAAIKIREAYKQEAILKYNNPAHTVEIIDNDITDTLRYKLKRWICRVLFKDDAYIVQANENTIYVEYQNVVYMIRLNKGELLH